MYQTWDSKKQREIQLQEEKGNEIRHIFKIKY